MRGVGRGMLGGVDVEYEPGKDALEREPKRGDAGLTVRGTALPPTARCDMTTFNTAANTSKVRGRFRLPDIPERHPDEVTQHDQLFKHGNSHHLAIHLGNPETTLVEADRWIIAEPGTFRELARYPDLLVAFGGDPAAYKASNGYIVSEQGKPPDFVLEVASPSTGQIDVGAKRDDYAALGAGEYWRFDETGEHHGAKLAGERLVDGEYVAFDIEELPGGSLRGYSPVLNLYLWWERGELVFYDPATGRPITTFEDERARADSAEAGLAAARARVRELEERLRRRDS